MKVFKIHTNALLSEYYFCIVTADTKQDAIDMVQSHGVIVCTVEEITGSEIVYHDHGYYN